MEEYKHFLTDEEDAELCRRTELHIAHDEGIKQSKKRNDYVIKRNNDYK